VLALAIGSDVPNGAILHDSADDEDEPPASVEPPPPGRLWWLRRGPATNSEGAPGVASVMVDTFNITQDRIMRSRLAGDPPDHMITMKPKNIGLFEFHRAAELIEFGRAAVRKAKPELMEHLQGVIAE